MSMAFSGMKKNQISISIFTDDGKSKGKCFTIVNTVSEQIKCIRMKKSKNGMFKLEEERIAETGS